MNSWDFSGYQNQNFQKYKLQFNGNKIKKKNCIQNWANM